MSPLSGLGRPVCKAYMSMVSYLVDLWPILNAALGSRGGTERLIVKSRTILRQRL
jgi:hypothetical protein